jgi:hypothetical protein
VGSNESAYLAALFTVAAVAGLGRAMFAATPRRTRVLLAKTVTIGSGGLLTGTAAVAPVPPPSSRSAIRLRRIDLRQTITPIKE